jgi:hypothetical protein
VTAPDDSTSSDEDEEYSQLYDLANSILEECKNAAPLSDLDTTICLFNRALDRRPAPHVLRSDSLKGLAVALMIRFSLTNQRQDLDQAISIYHEVMRDIYDTQLGVRVCSQFGSRIFVYYFIGKYFHRGRQHVCQRLDLLGI